MDRLPLLGLLALFLAACVKDAELASRTDGAPTGDAPWVVEDAPRGDVPAADAPAACGAGGIACCPADLNSTGGAEVVTIRYPLLIVRPAPGTDGGAGSVADGGTGVEFDGTWDGVTRLATPVTSNCVARFVTSPPSAPCAADAVVRITRAGLPTYEALVGLPAAELTAIPRGITVRVRVRGGSGSFGRDGHPDDMMLEVFYPDGSPLLVAATFTARPGPGAPPSWTHGNVVVRRSETAFCRNELMPPCRRALEVDAIVASADGRAVSIAPGDRADIDTTRGRFRVWSFAVVRRADDAGVSCADFIADRYSYAIVRLAN